jgi:hypothetical protein
MRVRETDLGKTENAAQWMPEMWLRPMREQERMIKVPIRKLVYRGNEQVDQLCFCLLLRVCSFIGLKALPAARSGHHCIEVPGLLERKS